MSLLTYLVFFAIAFRPWILKADSGEPLGYLSNTEDHWLVLWVLGWVERSLLTAPSAIFDVPINYPATGQLAAIEHFLSTGVAVTPILAATGNALLAANVAAIASYPLAAFVMSRLLVTVGCAELVAWVGGLMFAVGPERVPGNLIVLKYLNFYLPLVALCLTKLRRTPHAAGAGWLALALTAALFSSYYLAVLVLFAAGIWGVFELCGGPSATRSRYFAWALAGSGIAVGLLAVFSLPYFARPEASGTRVISYKPSYEAWVQMLAGWRVVACGWGQVGLALLAILLVWRRATVGLLARRGLLFAALGFSLMLGPSQVFFGYRVLLPFWLLLHTPAGFFRYPFRFSVLFGFGLALLFSSTLQAVRERLGGAWGSALVAVAALIALRGPVAGLNSGGWRKFPVIQQPIYAAVEQIAAQQGPGPLLELPTMQTDAAARTTSGARVEVQSMVAWTRHHQPLVLGYVDFPPPHRAWLNAAVEKLPAGDGLQTIIDMTRLRWILLRPEAAWENPADRTRLMQQQGLVRVLSQDGWDLLRVDRPARHPEWADAIAAGVRPGYTVLGTPLVKLRGEKRRGALFGMLPGSAYAGAAFPLKLMALNLGTATWPVTSARKQRIVSVVTRWHPVDAPPTQRAGIKRRYIPFTRDIGPGEREGRVVYVRTPRQPGWYDLELQLTQGAKNAFDGPGDVKLTGRVKLMPRPSPGRPRARRTSPHA